MPFDARDENIRQRANLSTLVPISLLGLAALVVLFQVNRIRENAKWVEHTEEAIGYCANVERIAREHKSAVLRSLLGTDTRDEEVSARTRTSDAILGLEHHVADNEAQLEQVKQLNARFRSWVEFTKGLRHQPGRIEQNLREIEQIKPVFDPIILAVNELEREERRLRAKRSEDFAVTTQFTVYGALPGLVVLVLVVGLFHRSQMLRLAKDFGDAMAGQEAARADLAQQSWVREQLTLLVGATRDDPGLAPLGSKLLQYLVDATGAVVGAFYAWDEAERKWVRHAKFGLPNAGASSFGEGEGVVGQAAKKTDVTFMGGMADDFFFVQAGTGQGTTREIALIPCHHDGQVLGVFELGFFGLREERAERLIQQCGESLGIAVSVTKKRLLQRELLVESKRQAEALQAQQEELRVTNEELASQSEALRAAHAQLEERKEELEASNADLVRQRDAVTAAREDLAARALELRRANRYKSEFLASMSHELRTPLNSCLILSRSLADNKLGNLTEEQVKFAETIYASGTDLLELINTVLDLSKVEAGAIELVNEETTVSNLVNPVLRVMEPIAGERHLQLDVRIPEPDAMMETDALRVQQILKNLLSNACKFTSKGTITLSVQVRPREVQFSVQDTGIGIAEDQLESIFEAFRQADGTASRRFGGTGLGLTISRDLAKRLGGDIQVESRAGVGSQFSLTIPRYATQPAEPTVNLRKDSAPEKVEVEQATMREVLVVRSDREVSAEINRIIQSWGFDVGHVGSNMDAATQLGTKPIAAVVGQRGVGVEELREKAMAHGVPFHVMDRSPEQDKLPSGILRHLRKPADEGELRRALKALFERSSPADGVLLVEDDEGFREGLESLLEDNNVRVSSTATVEGALKSLQNATFACVILDLQLADGRGEDLLRTIANNDAYSFPHVIVYTGEQLTGEQEQELLRFSDAVILKGLRSEERLLDELSLFLHDLNQQSDRPRSKDKRSSVRPKGGTSSLKGRTVLLVEDDIRNVYALTSVLEREGVKVQVARNGREALTKLESAPGIELVLMDIMMPEMNGFDAMQAIRKSQARWQAVPIIALTAKAMRDDRKACLEAGANDYVTKPIDIEKLLSLMRIWLDRA